MDERRSNFEYQDLIACGRRELFDKGPQLPLPPMLMFVRISEIAEVGGEYGKGLVRAGGRGRRADHTLPLSEKAQCVL
jgi:3-hydroxyacyl-[acyl-carrier protein] dehydratase / trans-2-decenoyl-[acyl-carrier protein] isomerase